MLNSDDYRKVLMYACSEGCLDLQRKCLLFKTPGDFVGQVTSTKVMVAGDTAWDADNPDKEWGDFAEKEIRRGIKRITNLHSYVINETTLNKLQSDVKRVMSSPDTVTLEINGAVWAYALTREDIGNYEVFIPSAALFMLTHYGNKCELYTKDSTTEQWVCTVGESKVKNSQREWVKMHAGFAEGKIEPPPMPNELSMFSAPTGVQSGQKQSNNDSLHMHEILLRVVQKSNATTMATSCEVIANALKHILTVDTFEAVKKELLDDFT